MTSAPASGTEVYPAHYVGLGMMYLMAGFGFTAQMMFFKQAVAQFGLWMPVTVLSVCGAVGLGVLVVVVTPLLRRAVRAVWLSGRPAGSCSVAGCSHDCRA